MAARTFKTRALFDYMKRRAAYENQEWGLTLAFLEDHFDQGIRTFFGVDLDEFGSLVRDAQQPHFFASYIAERNARN